MVLNGQLVRPIILINPNTKRIFLQQMAIDVIHIIVRVCASLSIIGAIFIVIHFILFKQLRSGIPNILLVLQALADLGVGITYVSFGIRPSSKACEIQVDF